MVTSEPSRQGAVLRAKAHDAYRRSLQSGAPLSAVALAETMGRSERWARAQIRAVQAAGTQAAAADLNDIVTGSAPVALTAETPDAPAAAEGPAAVAPPERASDRKAAAASVPESADSSGDRQTRPSGYWWSLNTFLGGVALSVAANVAHSFHLQTAPGGAQSGFDPDPGAVVAAACWPLLLLGAVEVVTRVPWPRGLWWSLARYGGAVMVALIAAYMSYRHMAGLLRAYGEDPLGAGLGPLAVDGMMVVSGFALLAIGVRRKAAAG